MTYKTILGVVEKAPDISRNYGFITVIAELDSNESVFKEVKNIYSEFPSEGQVIYYNAPNSITEGLIGLWRVELWDADTNKPRYCLYRVESQLPPNKLWEVVSLPLAASERELREILLSGIVLEGTPIDSVVLKTTEGLLIGPIKLYEEKDGLWRVNKKDLNEPLKFYNPLASKYHYSVSYKGHKREFLISNAPFEFCKLIDCQSDEDTIRYTLNYIRKNFSTEAISRRVVSELVELVDSKLELDELHTNRILRTIDLLKCSVNDDEYNIENLYKALLEYKPFSDVLLEAIQEETSRFILEFENKNKTLIRDMNRLEEKRTRYKTECFDIENKIKTKGTELSELEKSFSDRLSRLVNEPYSTIADISVYKAVMGKNNSIFENGASRLFYKIGQDTDTYPNIYYEEKSEFLDELRSKLVYLGASRANARNLAGTIIASALMELPIMSYGSMSTEIGLSYRLSTNNSNSYVAIVDSSWTSVNQLLDILKQVKLETVSDEGGKCQPLLLLNDMDMAPIDFYLMPYLRNKSIFEYNGVIPQRLQIFISGNSFNRYESGTLGLEAYGPIIDTDFWFTSFKEFNLFEHINSKRLETKVFDLWREEISFEKTEVFKYMIDNLESLEIKLPNRLKNTTLNVLCTLLSLGFDDKDSLNIVVTSWIYPYLRSTVNDKDAVEKFISLCEYDEKTISRLLGA